MTISSKLDDSVVRGYRVEGGAGTELYVEEAGNPLGRPVLFIHGFSQCRLAWDRQMRSNLGRDLRVLAMDLRGHGRSEKPRDVYGELSYWADDIHAIMVALNLEQPILCGWSYGGVIIGDYLRRYGDQALGGVSLVSAVCRLGEPVMPFLGPEFVAALPGMFSDEVEVSTAALEEFVAIAVSGDLTPDESYRRLGYNTVVPPHVRRALMSRTVDDDIAFAQLSRPTLISHGLADKIVLPAMSEHHARLIPHATVSYYPGVGHTPFWEEADRFNDELQAFASAI